MPYPEQYRLRLLVDVFWLFVLPSTVLSSTMHYARDYVTLGLWTAPCHIAFILLCALSRQLYTHLHQSLEAKQLGAKHIPQVKGRWPGNVDVLLRMMRAFRTSYVMDVYLELFEEYQCTTLNTRILWFDTIITMDQEHTKFVLSTGFHSFWRGTYQKERMETFLGNGIFNRDDEKWKMHRSMARPFFIRDRISDFDIYERHCDRALAIIARHTSSNLPCEAQDLFARFTLDSASEFLFGRNLDTLSASLPVASEAGIGPKGSATHDSWGSFAQAFEMAQQVITTRARLGYYMWPLVEFFRDKSTPHRDAIRKWLDPLVEETLAEKVRIEKAGVVSPIEDKTFLQHLADSTDDSGLIRDQLLSMLLASRDTTACLLTFVTYFLAIHPEMAFKLRSEVLSICGPNLPPTYAHIHQMRYMRAVIHEVLRLFPPVPLNIRESRPAPCAMPPSDSTYPSDSQPFYMPRSTSIIYIPLLTQRNKHLWGDDADVFDPERWIDPERLARFTSNPMMYTPFSAGPRSCIGQNFALNEASFFLVRLLQQFDTFTLASDVQPPASLPPFEWKERKGRQAIEQIWPAAALTLYIKGGMWVRFGKSQSLQAA